MSVCFLGLRQAAMGRLPPSPEATWRWGARKEALGSVEGGHEDGLDIGRGLHLHEGLGEL